MPEGDSLASGTMGSDTGPTTRESMLGRLHDGSDGNAWAVFDAIYRPFIHTLSRREGLNDNDAEEVTQRVLIKLVRCLPGFQYDRQKGRFRDWLNRVTHNEAMDFLKRKPPDAGVGGSDIQQMLENIPDRPSEGNKINEELRELFKQVADRVRLEVGEQKWNIFAAVLDGRSVNDIRGETGIPIARLHKYCTQVRRLLRKEANEKLDGE
jgi:RNA polymerase sigma-70 factor (ECF subfamily)